jgi:hypothetical protein
LNVFGDDLAMLTARRIVSDQEVADSLLRASPMMEISIADIADRTYVLKLFYNQSNNSIVGWKDGEALYFDREQVRGILRPRSFFVKQ